MAKLTLRDIRLNLHLSVKQVSELTGVSESTIRRMEKDCGKSRWSTFEKLVKIYRISTDHIYISEIVDLKTIN